MTMQFDDVTPLLRARPLPLEVGYERFANGVLHVACRTDMHGCTGAMFEWWFRFRPDTQQYIWWHPLDHISSSWAEVRDGTHVGSIHVVEEFFTGLPSEKLSIQFRDPTEFFAAGDYREARASGSVSAAVCARIGLSHEPKRTADGAVLGGRLLHIARDTPWGCALRSHFYLGQDLPALGMSRAEIEQAFSDDFGVALLQHCYNEFTFLSRFLPSLYQAENRKQVPPLLPW
jgi:DAPG hydrolase PhiG domain